LVQRLGLGPTSPLFAVSNVTSNNMKLVLYWPLMGTSFILFDVTLLPVDSKGLNNVTVALQFINLALFS